QNLVASDRAGNDWFGLSVAISAETAIVGAVAEDHDTTGGSFLNNAGSAYIFNNRLITSSFVENSFRNDRLVVYPNPSNGNFYIDLGAIYQNAKISITDISGKLIDSKTIVQSQIVNLSIEEPTGVYFLLVQVDNKKAVIRLVKQ
ncbi:MAG: T9SS type A sorting domain-containing protein, partial [Candidatus Paceibacterota bacterium]